MYSTCSDIWHLALIPACTDVVRVDGISMNRFGRDAKNTTDCESDPDEEEKKKIFSNNNSLCLLGSNHVSHLVCFLHDQLN